MITFDAPRGGPANLATSGNAALGNTAIEANVRANGSDAAYITIAAATAIAGLGRAAA